jgi:hypothetical protein
MPVNPYMPPTPILMPAVNPYMPPSASPMGPEQPVAPEKRDVSSWLIPAVIAALGIGATAVAASSKGAKRKSVRLGQLGTIMSGIGNTVGGIAGVAEQKKAGEAAAVEKKKAKEVAAGDMATKNALEVAKMQVDQFNTMTKAGYHPAAITKFMQTGDSSGMVLPTKAGKGPSAKDYFASARLLEAGGNYELAAAATNKGNKLLGIEGTIASYNIPDKAKGTSGRADPAIGSRIRLIDKTYTRLTPEAQALADAYKEDPTDEKWASYNMGAGKEISSYNDLKDREARDSRLFSQAGNIMFVQAYLNTLDDTNPLKVKLQSLIDTMGQDSPTPTSTPVPADDTESPYDEEDAN